MPPKIRELKSKLRKAGFVAGPGKGSHTNWTHPRRRDILVTISGHDGDDAQPYQISLVRDALKETGNLEGEGR
jgi:predicted RNA binding protein YcfA (HicA-like mRNA interferase family)